MAVTKIGTNIILKNGDQLGSPEISMTGATAISVQVNTTTSAAAGDLKYSVWGSSGAGWENLTPTPVSVGTIGNTVTPHTSSVLKGAACLRIVFEAAADVTFDASVNTYQE